MRSLWTESVERTPAPPLRTDLKTDVLIVGGGMAGILCAHKLKEAGVKYALIEADRLCSGVTAYTTAKITYQHRLIYARLIKKLGKELTRGYLEANKAALNDYKTLCSGIECEYAEADAFTYSLSSRGALEEELRAYEMLGERAVLRDRVPLPISAVGAIGVSGQAYLNPLKLALTLAGTLNVYEGTKALEFGDGFVVTNGGRITADKIIIATHFPIVNKHGSYFLKLYQHRSYVLALEGAPRADGMYVDEAKRGMSFRNHGKYLLIGGGDHRTGKQGGGWRELEEFAKKHYTGATVKARWATQDCMSLDGVPYVGRYSARTDRLFVATGFNKWGMTGSMAAASVLCDLVQGKRNEYAEVFSPSRSIMTPQLALNAASSVIGLLTPTLPRCPHLGCALKYNKAEHTWDCPCHGSRFEGNGELINGPATDDSRSVHKRAQE